MEEDLEKRDEHAQAIMDVHQQYAPPQPGITVHWSIILALPHLLLEKYPQQVFEKKQHDQQYSSKVAEKHATAVNIDPDIQESPQKL